MSADLTTVENRVTEILNACAAGAFSSTIAANHLDRNATAISEAVREAALMIGGAIVSNPRHVHRNLYISASPTSLTHQAEMPDMSAETDLIEIQPYSGAGFIAGTPKSVQQIESWRSNPGSIYGSIGHTTQNSPLGGYYAMEHGRFYFTGYAAQGYFPSLDRDTITDQIPDEAEGIWVCLSVGLTVKEGDNLFEVARYYYQMGLQNLAALASMSIVKAMPTVEQAKQARGL